MSLLDDLRRIEHFPPSHLPSINEVLHVVGVLAAYVEHGDELLQAVETDRQARENGEPATAVGELLSPPEQEPEPEAAPAAAAPTVPLGVTTSQGSAPSPAAPADVPPPHPAPAGAPDARDERIAELKRELADQPDAPDPRDAEIAALEQQLQTRRAQPQRTQVSVEPGDPPAEPSPPSSGLGA